MQRPPIFYGVLLSIIALSLLLAGCDDDQEESSIDSPKGSTTTETGDDADDKNDELSEWKDWSCDEQTAARVDEWLTEAHEWRDGGAQVELGTDSLPLADGPRLPAGADVNVAEFDGERLQLDNQGYSLATLRDDPSVLRDTVDNSPLGIAIDGSVSSANALQLLQLFNDADVLGQFFVLAAPPRSEALRDPLDVLSDASKSGQAPLEPRKWAEGCEPLEDLFDETNDDFEILANSLTEGWMKCECEPELKSFLKRNVATVATTDGERVVTYTDLTLTDDDHIAIHAANDTDDELRTVAIRDTDVLTWSDIVPRRIRPARVAPVSSTAIVNTTDIDEVITTLDSDDIHSVTDLDEPRAKRPPSHNEPRIDDVEDDEATPPEEVTPPEKGELSPTMTVSIDGVDENAYSNQLMPRLRSLDRIAEACYETELVVNPNARGAVRLELTLEKERGWRFTSPEILEDDVGGNVGQCLATYLDDTRVPPPEDDHLPSPITITYEFSPS